MWAETNEQKGDGQSVKCIGGDFLIGYQHADLSERPIYTGNARSLQLFVREYRGIFRAVGTVHICPNSMGGAGTLL